MNLTEAARNEATRIVDRLEASRQPLQRALLVAVLCQAFTAGALYGIGRTQHALAIARTAAKAEHPLDRDEPFNDGVDYGLDRAQRSVVATHEAAQRQASE